MQYVHLSICSESFLIIFSMQIQVEQLRKICQNSRRVSERQRWATATFLIALIAALPKPLLQRFPNFLWSRTICGLCIFTAYHLENTLFQENSIYPMSFDQRFGKPDFTQMRHGQQGCEKLQWAFLETNKGTTQKCRNLSTEHDQWKQNVFFLCRRTEGSSVPPWRPTRTTGGTRTKVWEPLRYWIEIVASYRYRSFWCCFTDVGFILKNLTLKCFFKESC